MCISPIMLPWNNRETTTYELFDCSLNSKKTHLQVELSLACPLVLDTMGTLIDEQEKQKIPFLLAIAIDSQKQVRPYSGGQLHEYFKIALQQKDQLVCPITRKTLEKVHFFCLRKSQSEARHVGTHLFHTREKNELMHRFNSVVENYVMATCLTYEKSTKKASYTLMLAAEKKGERGEEKQWACLLMEKFPESEEACIARSKMALQEQKYEEIEKEIGYLLQKNKEHREGLLIYGKVTFALERFADSYYAYSRAALFYPREPRAFLGQAAALQQLICVEREIEEKERRELIDLYSKVIELDPVNKEARLSIADLDLKEIKKSTVCPLLRPLFLKRFRDYLKQVEKEDPHNEQLVQLQQELASLK